MKHGKPDYILLGAVIVLVILGILILSSVSAFLPIPSNSSGWENKYFSFAKKKWGVKFGSSITKAAPGSA